MMDDIPREDFDIAWVSQGKRVALRLRHRESGVQVWKEVLSPQNRLQTFDLAVQELTKLLENR